MFTIRKLELQDERRWRELWQGYCDFYKMSLSGETTDYLWDRLMKNQSTIFAIVAEDAEGSIWGIANCVVHESTSSLLPICCLQDLFVDPSVRNQGIGKALMEWLLAEMKRQNWSRVYWHTREDNHSARKLYDKFTSLNHFVRYVVTHSPGTHK